MFAKQVTTLVGAVSCLGALAQGPAVASPADDAQPIQASPAAASSSEAPPRRVAVWSQGDLFFTGELAKRAITKRFLPAYPSEAWQQGVEGTVMLRATVRKDGVIDQVVVAQSSGRDEFDVAARDTLMKWTFGLLDPDGAEQQTGDITMRFRLRVKDAKRTDTPVDQAP
jgi:TonB family protein